jgi:predicted aspartyl protease
MAEVRTIVTLTNATDTGAVRTVLPPHVAQQLDLAIRGQRVVELADGRKENVGVTEPVEIDIDGRNTIEDALVLGTR